jgi:hypothetical protein
VKEIEPYLPETEQKPKEQIKLSKKWRLDQQEPSSRGTGEKARVFCISMVSKPYLCLRTLSHRVKFIMFFFSSIVRYITFTYEDFTINLFATGITPSSRRADE